LLKILTNHARSSPRKILKTNMATKKVAKTKIKISLAPE